MGTEYYLIKPEKKEVFYLAKHFNNIEGIKSATYCESTDSADYLNYENYEDFFWNMLRENWEYFSTCDLTLEQVSDVVYKIYEWCASDKVILDNDCSNTCEVWKDWEETGNITSILEGIHSTPKNDMTFINELLEENESLLFENPSYKSALIGITTDGRAVYDYSLMVEDLMKEDDIDYEEAVEFIDYNTLGVLPPVADTKYPIVIQERNA